MSFGRMFFVVIISSSIVGCDDGKPIDSCGCADDTSGQDADGDGYTATEDCDDEDAAINPGADEECDGLDNNCDDEIDEGVTSTWYADGDGDGFGDAGDTVEACEPSDGWIAVSGDCDDADEAINPSAAEICDGADNDCDTLTDEDGGLTLYADEDGDGYGDADAPTTGCAATTGLSEDASDCDDADAGINPAAAEICDDGVDQDCDAADGTCTRYAGEIDVGTANAQLMGEAGDYAGSRVRPAGDVNGDGADDLLVDLYGYGPSSKDWSGAVALVHGPVTGELVLETAAASLIYGATEGEYVGWGLARGEDLDGDGTPDMAIGAYGRWDATRGVGGGAYIVYGPPAAGASSLASADAVIVPDDGNISMLGYDMSSSADLTGDGVGDVVLGSYGSGTDSYAGAAWVLAGPYTGTVTLADAITISGAHPLDLAGNGLDGVGDVNGDGAPDLVVGAHGDDEAGDAAGAAAVFYGPLASDLSMEDADRKLLGEKAAEEFSRNGVNGRGDVDGDGTDDLLISAFFGSPAGSYSGAAYLFLGDAAATGSLSASSAEARLYGSSDNQFFGRSLDIAGDVDADGHADLLIGGQGYDGGGAEAGAVSLVYGPVSGSYAMGAEDAIWLGEANGDGLGISAAGAGDTNGDGRDDVLMGAWFNGDNGAYAGSAYLFSGG